MFDLATLLFAVFFLLLLGLASLLAPYLSATQNQTGVLESDVAATSFECKLNELCRTIFQPPSVYLSLVVPAYNEEFRLPSMLEDTLVYLQRRAAGNTGRFSYEVIVVDDGSADGTFATAEQIARAKGPAGTVRVVRLARNRGKGFAVRVGMLVARGEWLLMVDADGATNIRDLERLEDKAKLHASAIAFGSRHHLVGDAVAKRAWYRNVLMFGFHLVVKALIGAGIQDTQCGFKLFSRTAAKRIFASLHLCRWAFDIEVVVLARILSISIVEVPVTWTEIPGSKLNIAIDSLLMLRDIVAVRLFYILKIWRPANVG